MYVFFLALVQSLDSLFVVYEFINLVSIICVGVRHSTPPIYRCGVVISLSVLPFLPLFACCSVVRVGTIQRCLLRLLSVVVRRSLRPLRRVKVVVPPLTTPTPSRTWPCVHQSKWTWHLLHAAAVAQLAHSWTWDGPKTSTSQFNE